MRACMYPVWMLLAWKFAYKQIGSYVAALEAAHLYWNSKGSLTARNSVIKNDTQFVLGLLAGLQLTESLFFLLFTFYI